MDIVYNYLFPDRLINSIESNNIEEVNAIINSSYCSKELLKYTTSYNGIDALHLACEMYPEYVKIILSSNCIDSYEFFEELIKKEHYGLNSLMTACKYQPEVVKYILEHKYFTEKILKLK